jgi:hypothetical protein
MIFHGAIAQLGERCNRTAEVVSSNLIGSTKLPLKYSDLKLYRFGPRKASYHIATNGFISEPIASGHFVIGWREMEPATRLRQAARVAVCVCTCIRPRMLRHCLTAISNLIARAKRRKRSGVHKALDALCRARDEIEIAMLSLDSSSDQHSRLMLIGRSIEAEILEIEEGTGSG